MWRSTLLLAVGLLLVVPPAWAGEPELPFEKFRLDNGMTVILHRDPAIPKVVVVTWYRVGSKDERPGRTGFAHLFEHLMFKGSAHIEDGKLDELLEEAGGGSNGYTNPDETVYYNYGASNFLEMMLWMDADRMAGLLDTLTQDKLDNQREVVRNERRQSYDNRPYGMVSIKMAELLWPRGHGYHWPTIGYHEDLVAASLDDVRHFFRTYYVPSNVILVIAGDFDPKEARRLVEKYFAWLPKAPAPERPSYEKPGSIRKEIRATLTDKVQVPMVVMEWRGPRQFTRGEASFDLAADILGGGKTSRLYRRLVYEDRLAQNAWASFQGSLLGGEMSIGALAKPGVDPEKIIAAIDDELARMAAEGPTEKELERAKNQLEARRLEGLQGLLNRALQLASYEAGVGDPGYLAKDLFRYREVTAARIQKIVAGYVQPHCRVLLLVLPQAEKGGTK